MEVSLKGTLLNASTVAVGGALGALAGRGLPLAYQESALHGLGLVTILVAVGMGLKARNPLLPAAAVALGGVLGVALGLQDAIAGLAGGMRNLLGGGGRFVEGFVGAFVLFCVGPMTVLGCVEDGLEGRTELLRLKSTLDGIAAFFLAGAAGWGVAAVAPALLVFQGAITLLAGRLAPIARDEEAMAALSSAGGAILLGTGFGLAGLASLHTENYLPAILLAPLFALGREKWLSRSATGKVSD